jgi:hypothetical protein
MLLGILVLLVGHLLWAVAFAMGYGRLINPIFLLLTTASAFVVAYLSARMKIIVGMSMFVFGAAIGLISRTLLERVGVGIDLVGTPVETFLILLAYNVAYATVGAVAGYLFWRYRR